MALLTLFGCGSTGNTTGPTTSRAETSSVITTASTSASPSVAGSTATTAATSASTTAAQPVVLPAVKILPLGGNSPAALQRFADDIAAGRIDTVISQCWTVSPERIRQTYTEAGRRAFLRAVADAGQGAQYGWYWAQDGLQIGVSWAELNSSYACPLVTGAAVPAYPGAMDGQLVVRRVQARIQGAPLRPKDTAANYPLFCDAFQADAGGFTGANETDLTAAQKAAVAKIASSSDVVGSSGQGDGMLIHAGDQARPSIRVMTAGDLCILEIAL